MADRITIAMLQKQVDRLNRETGSPTEPWPAPGQAAVGCYVLGQHYRGVSLARLVTDGGGESTVFHTCTRRELWDQLHALLRGVEIGKATRT